MEVLPNQLRVMEYHVRNIMKFREHIEVSERKCNKLTSWLLLCYPEFVGSSVCLQNTPLEVEELTVKILTDTD